MTENPRARRAIPQFAGLLALPAALVTLGCAHIDPGPAFREVAELVTERQATAPSWSQGSNPARIEPGTVLTRDQTVSLALAHNAAIQATFEQLGLASADLVEAGLLQNPGLHASARSPEGGGAGTNIELGLAQNLLQIFTLRANKRVAANELEETKLLIAQAVLDLARDTELAYFGLVAARQQVELRATILEASRAGYELAQRFNAAGNINELQLRREQSLFEAARIAHLEARKEESFARRQLRDLLGTWGESEANWQVGARLPDVPASEVELQDLEQRAAAERFDILAAQREVEGLRMAVGINRRWRLLGGLDIEASAEQELDGDWVIGPGIDIELPLFSQGQPRIARGEAALRRAERLLEARVARARSEVIQLHQQLSLERELAARYLQEVIPMQQRTVQLAQEQYNYMLAGIFEVLQAKQQEYEAYQSYIDTVRDYWQARARLRFAVGGRFPGPTAKSVSPAGPNDSATPSPGSGAPDLHAHHSLPGASS